MLSRVAIGLRPATARLAVRTMPRALCAVAETEVRLVDTIRADIIDMKAKIAGEGVKKAGGYSPAEFEAAIKAGTVDPSLVNEALEGFPDEARKLVLKNVAASAKMLKEQEASSDVDWASFEAKLGSELVAEVKAITDKAVADAEAEHAGDNTFAELTSEVTNAFKGSNGLFELASKEEKAAAAGMETILTEMEQLETYVEGVADLTIAEILEREPELRAEIEEELKNDVWAP